MFLFCTSCGREYTTVTYSIDPFVEIKGFLRADSPIVFVAVSNGYCSPGGPCPPLEKALSSSTELQTYLVSCFVYFTSPLPKGIIQTINFVDHKLSSLSNSLRFSEISADGL